MKKSVLFIFGLFLSLVAFGQPRTPFRNPIWMGEQPSYFNSKQNKNVRVFVGRTDNDFVTFNISDVDDTNDVNIMFFDRNKLLTALNVCSEALAEVSTLSRKAKRAIVEGMDTIFPRAAIMWHDADTFSGDPDVTLDYSLVFSSSHEVDELIQCIVNNTEHPVFGNISIQEAFPRVIDRNHNPHTFNGFMRRLNPTWVPQRRPVPFVRPQR